MRFTKMNGAGNDFLILDAKREPLPMQSLPAIAKTLCDRRRSLGADGLMVVTEADDADFAMLFFNPDGTMGEMCGNGARCICRYGFENGYCGETQTVRTTAGIVTGERIDRRNYRIRLPDPSELTLYLQLSVNRRNYTCAYVVLGDPGIPHAVVEYPGLARADENRLFELGRAFRYHPSFPKGANVNFFALTGKDEVLLKTYERGVEDFTYACGTGTGSVAAALYAQNRISGRNVRFTMQGGVLTMDTENGLYLTGATKLVAVGEIKDEDLEGEEI